MYKHIKALVVQCSFELQVSQNKALLDQVLVSLLKFHPVRGFFSWSLPASECSHLSEISRCFLVKPSLQFPCISAKVGKIYCHTSGESGCHDWTTEEAI